MTYAWCQGRLHLPDAGAGADMQWCTQDGTKGLLELAWEQEQLHTLSLLVSMGVGWRAPFRFTTYKHGQVTS
jgi:hypothetical protein